MLGRLDNSKRVKKGEAIKLHPLPAETRTELDRSLQEEQAARIRGVYLDKRAVPKKSEVGEAKSMRERILSLSLFPNLYN